MKNQLSEACATLGAATRLLSALGIVVVLAACSQKGESFIEGQPDLATPDASGIAVPHARAPSEPTDMAVAPPPRREVFFASGHMGRTVMSCDDGMSWINDQSQDDAARCWVTGDPNYVECDHSPYAGTGLDFADGTFYATFGWGYDGVVRKTRDGVNWTEIKSGGWGGGIAATPTDVLLMWEGAWSTSVDQGGSWAPVTTIDPWSFDHPHPGRLGTKIFAVDRAGKMALSRDGGMSWSSPTGYDPSSLGTYTEGNGVLVAIGNTVVSGGPNVGTVSRSVDDGNTWTSTQLFTGDGMALGASLIWTGTQFVTRVNEKAWTSADGVTWSQTPMTLDGAAVPSWWTAAVGYNPHTGTFVAFPTIWGGYYDAQHAFRSKDGIAWTTLPAGNFKGGHPLWRIVVGDVDPGVCP
jgi:hypothetical protein